MSAPRSKLAPVVLILAGCASQTALPKAVQVATNQSLRDTVVELRQSCFFGDLYDDNAKWLLSPHAFDHVHHIVDLSGKPIHPPNQRGIVPAGTRFRVVKIEFPTVRALATRMLTTPRYNPWLYLRPIDPSPRLPNERRYWLLMLPRDLTDQPSLDQALSRLIAPQGEVRTWLAQRRPLVQVAIKHKDLRPGMSLEEVVAAMGEPRLWLNDVKDGQPIKVAWFGGKEAWFTGQRVVEVRQGRDKKAPPAP